MIIFITINKKIDGNFYKIDGNFRFKKNRKRRQAFVVVVILQSAGGLMFSSMMISPTESALMMPVRGFLMLVMWPLMVALTSEYSKAKSASSRRLQFSNTRLSQ